MFDVYLFEPDKVHQQAIRDIFARYSIKRNNRSDIKVISEIPEMINISDGFSSETAVYIISCGQNTAALSESISEINSSNYKVLMADGVEDVLAYTTPALRPAGIIIRPAEYSAVEKLLDEIYADYKRFSSRKQGLFRFKIRSREYAVSADNILYFEATGKKMILRTVSQAFEFYMSAEEILKNLPDRFVRIHKSFIVNIDRIAVADYKNMTAELDDGSVVYISRTYKDELKARLAGRD